MRDIEIIEHALRAKARRGLAIANGETSDLNPAK